MASGLVKLRVCVGRKALFFTPDGGGDVLMRFGGEGAIDEAPMAWSWLRILGNSRGPWVRIGERAGVVLRVLVVANDSEGDDSME